MGGTGFIGGKGRVCKIFETEIDAGTRAKRIKAEYGQGGAHIAFVLHESVITHHRLHRFTQINMSDINKLKKSA